MRRALVLLGALAALAVLAADANVFPAPGPILTPVSPGSPPSGSYPDATGTGIGLNHPDCATLCPSGRTTSAGGDISTSKSCMTYTSQIDIVADDVTVQCSELTGPTNSYGVRIGKSGNVAARAIITKNKIHNAGIPQGKCIYATGYGTGATISYNEMTDCEDAIHSERSGSVGDPYVIEWNWIHDLRDDGGEDLHQDGLAMASGSNVTVQNNRFGPFTSPNLSATMMIQPAGSCPTMDNLDFISNYIEHDGVGNNVLNDKSDGCTCTTDTWFIDNVIDSSGSFISYGTGLKECVPLASRSGGCTGNTFVGGGAAGC